MEWGPKGENQPEAIADLAMGERFCNIPIGSHPIDDALGTFYPFLGAQILDKFFAGIAVVFD